MDTKLIAEDWTENRKTEIGLRDQVPVGGPAQEKWKWSHKMRCSLTEPSKLVMKGYSHYGKIFIIECKEKHRIYNDI